MSICVLARRATKLDEMQKTMALLDEWQVPEPSYFDVRLQAPAS
jgi:hypothetical protein